MELKMQIILTCLILILSIPSIVGSILKVNRNPMKWERRVDWISSIIMIFLLTILFLILVWTASI